MKVKVDFDVCESNELCVGLAPHVFEVDDDDNLQIINEDVDDAELAAVRLAVAACPRAAISLVESE